jgi:two-component system NtrC family sensor kinase
VLKDGQPIIINENTPQKIKTSFLVRSLVYVPMLMEGKVLGVLSVDNRESSHTFIEYDKTLLASLADYASIAIKNARFYTEAESERHQWEQILTNVKDGVIVLDTDKCIMLINQTARQIFALGPLEVTGVPLLDVIKNPDLLETLSTPLMTNQRGYEINLEDGRVFNTQLTSIPEVGYAITMQDITHLKELDRIKSEFVSTVSHDLRSPLTAILGYSELVGRAGTLNPRQKEFIDRVQNSVQSITALINDLLDLGRIEAGFDAHKEITSIAAIARYTVDGVENAIAEKPLKLSLEIPEDLPPVWGNPIRLQQMLANLINNAINYTPAGGKIKLRAVVENDQIIMHVSDTGPGVMPAEQPYIFDKFFRGSNLPAEVSGTGLGLAIVKSIVEDHQGRIWVDSIQGKGSTFIVVLPVASSE